MAVLTGSLLSDLIPDDWRHAIEPDLSVSDLDALAYALNAEQHRILPAQALWFRALRDTPLATVRAVILGQDPYPNPRQAEGLAFSVPDGEAVPVSLRRILVEAGRTATIAPGRTSLVPWADRGVLLLNTALTVPIDDAGGHATIGWRPVTEAILRAVAAQPRPVLFMAWGRHAQAALRRAGIEDGQRQLVVLSAHPADRRGSFVRSDPFGRANGRLSAAGGAAIDWSLS